MIATALSIDPAAGAGSDGNGIFEPGETSFIAPSWKNEGTAPVLLTGTASAFAGPGGGSYSIVDGDADYGSIGVGATASCVATANCYALFAVSSGLRPVTHWDTTFLESPSTGVPKTWTLHLGDSFTDVPRSYPFYRKVETVLHNRITVGCTSSTYCPNDKVPRSQMAIFIARGLTGGGVIPASGMAGGQPYNCVAGGVSLFSDVSPTDIFCRGVHYILAQNITSGCAAGLYCPTDNVSRADMAIFVAKAMVAPGGGSDVPTEYGPDPVTGFSYSCNPASPNLHFTDVTVADSYCRHVHYLWARAVISGCSATQYCPNLFVARDEMSKFLSNAFQLLLYGP